MLLRTLTRSIAILFIVIVVVGDARADLDETLLYLGYGSLVAGSALTAVHNAVASPSHGWNAAGGFFGVTNIPIGGILLLSSMSLETDDPPAAVLALSGMHFILAGSNLWLYYRGRKILRESKEAEESRCILLEWEVTTIDPSLRVGLCW